jgi:hypothetical protein
MSGTKFGLAQPVCHAPEGAGLYNDDIVLPACWSAPCCVVRMPPRRLRGRMSRRGVQCPLWLRSILLPVGRLIGSVRCPVPRRWKLGRDASDASGDAAASCAGGRRSGAAEAIEIDYEILAAPLDLAREGRAARHARLWGQAIMEPPVYDPISRQLLPGNLMDYALPHANEFPDVKGSCWRSRSRPIRWASKGADEAGAAGSPPTVINGIIDTMGGIGRMLLDMPTTPELVCRAMGGGESLIESVDGKTRKSKCPYIMS